MGGHRIRPEVAPGQPIEPRKNPQERGIRWYETWNDHELFETLICDTVIYCIQYTPLKLNMAPKNGGWRTVLRIFSESMFVLRVNGMSVRHLHWNTNHYLRSGNRANGGGHHSAMIMRIRPGSAVLSKSEVWELALTWKDITLPLRNMEIQNGSKLE